MRPESFLAVVVLVLASCAASRPTEVDRTGEPAPDRNAELLRKHTEIWNLMGLSISAADELNGIVVAVNARMEENRREKPHAFAQAMEVKRARGEMAHADYIANHERRFELLRISPPTQKELLAAADFTWKALHDPDLPPEKMRTAQTIQAMMKAMGGPPPCCDDNLFVRAAP